MKLSKDELIAKVNEKVMDEDVKIELMEDITDSFEGDTSENDTRIAELEEKLKVMTEKYKERFLKGDEKKEDDAEEQKEDVEDEMEEKEVIDIKEI